MKRNGLILSSFPRSPHARLFANTLPHLLDAYSRLVSFSLLLLSTMKSGGQLIWKSRSDQQSHRAGQRQVFPDTCKVRVLHAYECCTQNYLVSMQTSQPKYSYSMWLVMGHAPLYGVVTCLQAYGALDSTDRHHCDVIASSRKQQHECIYLTPQVEATQVQISCDL